MSDAPLGIVLLASGTGTLLQSVLDNIDPAAVRVLAAGSDRQCEALERASKGGVDVFRVDYTPGQTDRDQWNRDLVEAIQAFEPDLVVSAGFMRILGPQVVQAFPGKIINTHPALLPAFPGAHGVRDALEYGVKVTGSTVHVVDTGVDTGPIIAQQPVAVEPNDTEASLHEKIKKVERQLLVDVLHAIAANGLSINGRKARTTTND